MKKATKNDDPEMRDHYDFFQGVRGKHFKAYRQGHEVHIQAADGSISIRHFSEEEGSVMVDPDLKAHFPDSQSVNKVLRAELRRTIPGSERKCDFPIIARMPWGEKPVTGIQNPSDCEFY